MNLVKQDEFGIDVDELEGGTGSPLQDEFREKMTVDKYVNPTPKKTKRSERNIAWIEEHCRIPEGKFVGQRVKLREFQKEVLRDIYSSPTRRYIFSVGRKNAKTGLSAFLLCLHIAGPEAVPNSQMYSTAQTKEQASVIFNLAAKCIRQSPGLSRLIQIKDSVKELVCGELGTSFKAMSADAGSAMGRSPILVVHDELGQVKGPVSLLYDAMETGSAAHASPLSIIISTQAPTDNDLLSRLIDDAIQGNDPKVKVRIYAAPMEVNPFSLGAIKAANPAFGDFQSKEELIDTAKAAKRMPSQEPGYRNLNLNQRVEMHSPFCSVKVWKENGATPTELDPGDFCFAGLDLSETTDLTAFVRVQRKNGIWSVHSTFWLPEVGLAEKARADRQVYDQWAEMDNGFGHPLLETTPGKAIEYEFVAGRIYDMHQECPITRCAFDRYNWKHLRPYLLKAGFEDWELAVEGSIEEKEDSKFVGFGQGFVSMSPALRSLETLLLNGKIAHGMHPVLTMCAANTVTQSDPAGNRKLSKSRSRGRIDGIVALAMAVGTGATELTEREDDRSNGSGGILIWGDGNGEEG